MKLTFSKILPDLEVISMIKINTLIFIKPIPASSKAKKTFFENGISPFISPSNFLHSINSLKTSSLIYFSFSKNHLNLE